MRRFFHRDDFSDLESALRDGRPEPGAELMHELTARVERETVRTPVRRPRVAAAVVFATVVLVALAAFGGAGYAKSSFVSAVKSSGHVVSSVVRQGDGKQGGPTVGLGDKGTPGGNGQGVGVQGGGKDGGDDNELETGPFFHGHDPPWVHQYTRFVVICVRIPVFRGRKLVFVYRTIVVPRLFVPLFVPPGTIGPCRRPPS